MTAPAVRSWSRHAIGVTEVLAGVLLSFAVGLRHDDIGLTFVLGMAAGSLVLIAVRMRRNPADRRSPRADHINS